MGVLSIDFTLMKGAFSLVLKERLVIDNVLGVLGPSGSGKSTLLAALAGLESAVRGTLQFDEEVWLDSASRINLPSHRRRIGFVFQDARLFPHLNVQQNIDFAVRRSPQPVGTADLANIMAALELQGLRSRLPDTLSGGEQQRVAIARALASSPQLLLMDEPMSATDGDRKSELLPYLSQIVATSGIPTVYVSHALDELATLSDQLLVLRGGKVVAQGPTREVMGRLDLKEVSSRDEAGAVIEASVLSHDEAFQLTQLDFAGQVLAVPRLVQAAGESVRLRIHARDVALALEKPSGVSIRNVLRGKVIQVQPSLTGPNADVVVDINGSHLRASVTRASVSDLGIREGQMIYALVKTASMESG